MRNTSSKYKELIQGVREFCAKIIINYADGSSQTLTELQDFKQLKFVDESSSSSEFEIGSAVIGEALITLNNRTGKFNNKTFYGAHISAYVGILVNEKPEFLEMGHYIVDEPVSPGISITLTAYDKMILLDKAYVPSVTYPATLAQIAQDACVQCGVILESLQFPRSSYVVATAPTDVTCREVMAAVAQLSGCYVKARPNGRIAITWYADAASNTISTLYSKNVCTDDVTITGITVISGETTAKSGADGYRLAISDNILLDEEKAQETADYLGNKLIGLTFRPLSVSCQSDPSIEAGDRIAVKDEKGNTYQTVVTSTTFAVLEAQKIACNAASPTVNGGQRLSETSKVIIASRKYVNEAVEYERKERETALNELNRQLAEGSGMYLTSQKQEDGSTIAYMHNKPELSDSMVIWKITAEAIGLSTDGGKTYLYGVDTSGKAILDKLYANGINADCVKIGKETVSQIISDMKKSVEKQGSSLETLETQIKEKVWREDINETNTAVAQTRTEVESLKTSTESLTTAMREYVKSTDFETYKSQISSQLEQTPDAITARFKTLEEVVASQGEDSSNKWKELETSIQLGPDGVTVGKKDDPISLVLGNGEVCFKQSGQKVSWMTDNQQYVSNLTVTMAASIAGLKISRNGRHIQIG